MRKAFILAALISIFSIASAQNRFDAAAFVGLNLSQVDGDGAGHYNHLGLRAGVGSSFDLGASWRIGVELAFTQKGAQTANTGSIDLQYIEMPILLSYSLLDDQLRIAAGVAPAVLVASKVTFDGIEDPIHSANYKRIDGLPITVALRYRFADHWCIDGRWQNSMLSVSKSNAVGTYRLFRSNKGTFSRLLTIGVAYQF